MSNIKLAYAGPLQFDRIGEVLRIRGDFLVEGEWTGMDGETVFYPKAVIQENARSIPGLSIKSGHTETDEAVVGFWTAYALTDNGIKAEGLIFQKDEINSILKGEKSGISPEVQIDKVVKDGKTIAVSCQYKAGALVENPACEQCRVESVATVSLKAPASLGQAGEGKIAPKPREVEKMSEEELKIGRSEFFDIMEKKLKEDKVPDEAIAKVLSLLKEMIKSPYPYPYPAPGKMEEPDDSRILTELKKPTKAAFIRWMRNKLKDAGLDRDAIGKVIDLLEEAIKVPYPYPYPAPAKKMEKSELEDFWNEEIKKLEEQVEGLEKDIDKKETELKTVKADLEQLKKQEDERKQTKIAALTAEIKAIDEQFDEKKYLEGITCPDAQIKMLEHELETVKRLSPAIKLSVATGTSTDEQMVEKELKAMFGSADIEEIARKGLPKQGGS